MRLYMYINGIHIASCPLDYSACVTVRDRVEEQERLARGLLEEHLRLVIKTALPPCFFVKAPSKMNDRYFKVNLEP